MKNSVCAIIFTVVGAGIGVLATAKYFDKKYKAIADEEIKSVREEFGKTIKNRTEKDASEKDISKDEEKKPTTRDTTSIDNYKNVVEAFNYSGVTEKEQKEMVDKLKEKYNDPSTVAPVEPDIRVISPDELGLNPEYEIISLTYYVGDDTLADDVDDAINDIDATVGEQALRSFGEYEDDAVHVVNDTLKCYYEILKDYRAWTVVTGRVKENIDES